MGLPVDVIAPEGAIYLSAQFALQGRVTPDGTRLDGDEAVRAYLLRAAGLAVVPLRAFGERGGHGVVPAVGGRGIAGGDRARDTESGECGEVVSCVSVR